MAFLWLLMAWGSQAPPQTLLAASQSSFLCRIFAAFDFKDSRSALFLSAALLLVLCLPCFDPSHVAEGHLLLSTTCSDWGRVPGDKGHGKCQRTGCLLHLGLHQ